MELGLYTFADNTTDPQSGKAISDTLRIKNLIEEIVLADQVDLMFSELGNTIVQTLWFPLLPLFWQQQL